jgi:DNA-directed RNA polymerase subunit RPC12/RpoP
MKLPDRLPRLTSAQIVGLKDYPVKLSVDGKRWESAQMANPNDPYAVTCDRCQGKMFVDGILCPKCSGDGRILIMPQVSTFSQRAARQMFWILLGASSLVLVAIALLHWFKLL